MNLVGVACGRLDAFYEIGFGGCWDVAAGELAMAMPLPATLRGQASLVPLLPCLSHSRPLPFLAAALIVCSSAVMCNADSQAQSVSRYSKSSCNL